MYEMLEQIILAARRKSPKGWGNIIFIVFLAIVWAIGAILKVKSKKAEEEKTGGQQLKLKPEGRLAEVTKKGPFQKIRLALEAELQRQGLQTQQAQRKLARPHPAAQKFTAKTESVTQIPALEQPTSQVQQEFQELPHFTDKAVRELKGKSISAPVQIQQAKYLSEILLDYSDPDELKRAILHYEILGRPLSLRGPAGIL